MTKTATKPRMTKEDALYAQSLTIGLKPEVWRAVRQAVLIAREKSIPEKHKEILPGAQDKIEAVLKAHDKLRWDGKISNYEAGEPNLYVESTLYGWSLLLDIIIWFGNELAKCPGGRTITVACSQVIHGAGAAEPELQKQISTTQ